MLPPRMSSLLSSFLSGIGFLPFCTFTMGLKRLLVCVSCSASRRQLHPGGPCLLGSCLLPEFGFLQAQTAHLKDHLKIRIHPHTLLFFPHPLSQEILLSTSWVPDLYWLIQDRPDLCASQRNSQQSHVHIGERHYSC